MKNSKQYDLFEWFIITLKEAHSYIHENNLSIFLDAFNIQNISDYFDLIFEFSNYIFTDFDSFDNASLLLSIAAKFVKYYQNDEKFASKLIQKYNWQNIQGMNYEDMDFDNPPNHPEIVYIKYLVFEIL